MTGTRSIVRDALGGPMISLDPPGAARGTRRWYGESLEWTQRLEQGLRRAHGRRVNTWLYDGCLTSGAPRVLAYVHDGLEVPGRVDPAPVRIEFHENPPYSTFGLHPAEYPRVFADPGAPSPHRMPDDDALCLYQPRDPVNRRWVSELGLVALLDMVRDHLYFEMRWRDTGGPASGTWLGEEAPHGFPRDGRRVR